MSESIIREIQALQRMTVGQLRVRWAELYSEETRSRNRTYLWRRLAWRIQELEYGGLSAEAKERMIAVAPATFVRSQLPAGYHPVAGTPPKSPGSTASRRDRRVPAPGSTLIRRYKGNDIHVLVLDDGFEWNGRRFDSLSEVAFAVTGSKWNGWLFFGLTARKRTL